MLPSLQGSRTGPALCALCGLVAVLGSTVWIYVLDAMGPTPQVDAIHHMVSEAARRTGGWAFDLALGALGLGTGSIVVSLWLIGLARPAACALMATTSAGLVLAALVTTNDPSSAPGLGAYVHLAASVLASATLPVGVLWMARPRSRQGPSRLWAAVAVVLAVAALPVTAYFVVIAAGPWVGLTSWRPVPVGLFQRVLAIDEVATVMILGMWAASAAVLWPVSSPPGPRAPGSPAPPTRTSTDARRSWPSRRGRGGWNHPTHR